MHKRPTWFWTSLFASIGVNGVMFAAGAAWLYSNVPVYQPGYARGDVSPPIYLVPNPTSIPETILGDSSGRGNAADATDGETPMESLKSDQTQSLLSRDVEGPGKRADEPSQSSQLPGDAGAVETPPPSPAPMFGLAESEAAQKSFASPIRVFKSGKPTSPSKEALSIKTNAGQASDAPTPPAAKLSIGPQLGQTPPTSTMPPAENRSPSEAADSVASQPVQVASIADGSSADLANAGTPPALASTPQPKPAPASPQIQKSAKPGPAVAPGDPAPKSETESDPFSKEGAVKFKRGSTDVQLGRKHKIIRPRLGLGAQADLLNLPSPVTLVLGLTLDETGQVISVDVLKSSGSRDVDQACKVAAYQWWLEPTRNKAGKPIKDVIPFTIGFS